MQSLTTHSDQHFEGFDRSLDELLHFADALKLREHERDQQHQLDLEKQKTEFDIQIELEKKRFKQLQDINRNLTEELSQTTQKHIELEQKYSTLSTRHNCCVEELKQIKEQNEKKRARIEELEKITQIFKNGKTKLEEENKQLTCDNELLKEKLKDVPVTSAPTTTIPDELIPLVQQAVDENQELKRLVSERESEIEKLNQQLNQMQSEDPQVVEQRLLQLMTKMKSDFRLMYENQRDFFMEKIDLLKQEQRENIASLYKH